MQRPVLKDKCKGMIVRRINPDDLKVIKYDGTNLDDVSKVK